MADKKEPGLTYAQEIFVQEVLKGNTQTDAYKMAYPNSKKWEPKSVWCRAAQLMATPKVKARYEELFVEFKARETEKTAWTREQAIEQLKFILEANKRDIERVEQAFEDDLQFLQQQIELNPDNAIYLTTQLLGKRKKSRVNRTNNDGIISAVSELNKMHGYNEQNLNVAGTVIFGGEEELED